MTKAELLERVHSRHADRVSKRRLERILDDTFEEIARGLRKGRFTYPGFGTFIRRKRSARRGWNPYAKEAISVPASVTVGFRPAMRLRDVASGRK